MGADVLDYTKVSAYLEHLAGQEHVGLPAGEDDRAEPVFHQFVVQLPASQRDNVRTRLSELGVGTLLHYPMSAHQMPAYRSVAVDPAGLSATEAMLPRIMSLPMGQHLSLDQAAQVAERLVQAIKLAS